MVPLRVLRARSLQKTVAAVVAAVVVAVVVVAAVVVAVQHQYHWQSLTALGLLNSHTLTNKLICQLSRKILVLHSYFFGTFAILHSCVLQFEFAAKFQRIIKSYEEHSRPTKKGG